MTTRDNINPDVNARGIERILRDRADAWRYSAELEKAAQLAADGGEMTPSARMALSYYQDGKMAAAAAGRDVSRPVADDNLSAAYGSLSNN